MFELTRNYDITVAAMVAVVFSNLVSHRLFGWFFDLAAGGVAPVDIVWDDRIIGTEVWAIPTATQSAEAARAFLAFALSPCACICRTRRNMRDAPLSGTPHGMPTHATCASGDSGHGSRRGGDPACERAAGRLPGPVKWCRQSDAFASNILARTVQAHFDEGTSAPAIVT